VSHALAFSQAVENACNCEIPERAKLWRVILAELERLYNHVQYLGYLSHTTTLKVGEAQGRLLEEQLKQLNAKVTGSRFLREMITPGGLRKEPQEKEIESTLTLLQKDIENYCQALLETYSHIDRLIGTGVLTKKVAFEHGATGPILRASGIKYDFRHDHPYAAYDRMHIPIPIAESGDANARMLIRIIEIKESISIIKSMLAHLKPGPIRSDCVLSPYAEGLGWAESPRGGLFYAVHLDGAGNLARVKINTPSFSNWRVFPSTVHETNMMDYAINEASFGLTVAECDR
jgi:formate hydrogenlyase subunit 5